MQRRHGWGHTAGRAARSTPQPRPLGAPGPRPEAAAAPGSPALGAVHAAALALGDASRPAAHAAAMGGRGGWGAGSAARRLAAGLGGGAWRPGDAPRGNPTAPGARQAAAGRQGARLRGIDPRSVCGLHSPCAGPACAPELLDCLAVLSMRRRIGWCRLMSPGGRRGGWRWPPEDPVPGHDPCHCPIDVGMGWAVRTDHRSRGGTHWADAGHSDIVSPPCRRRRRCGAATGMCAVWGALGKRAAA